MWVTAVENSMECAQDAHDALAVCSAAQATVVWSSRDVVTVVAVGETNGQELVLHHPKRPHILSKDHRRSGSGHNQDAFVWLQSENVG